MCLHKWIRKCFDQNPKNLKPIKHHLSDSAASTFPLFKNESFQISQDTHVPDQCTFPSKSSHLFKDNVPFPD